MKFINQPRIKNGTQVTLNLSSNMAGGSNNETSFQHMLLLTNMHIGFKALKYLIIR